MPSQLTLNDDLIDKLKKVTGYSPYIPDQNKAFHGKVRDMLTEAAITKLLERNHPITPQLPPPTPIVAVAPPIPVAPQLKLDDEPPLNGDFNDICAIGPWPLTPVVTNLLRSQGFSTHLLRPDPNYDDEEKHLEEKKSMIRDGYFYFGMDDPDVSLSHAFGDIDEHRLWSTLSSRAQAAHRVAKNKYRTWKLKQRTER